MTVTRATSSAEVVHKPVQVHTPAFPIGGFGIVGLGVGGKPSTKRKAPERCAEYGHPGVTYHPQQDKTWCLCGHVVTPGDTSTHAACCGGTLEEDLTVGQ